MTTWVIAKCADHEKEAITSALARADRAVEFFDTTEGARIRLEQDAAPFGLLVSTIIPGSADLLGWVRGEGRLFSVPIIGVVENPTDQAFGEAHAMGVDDVIVRGDGGAVTRRLANLAGLDRDARPPLSQGQALIVHEDETQRRVLGRILRQAGFDPAFSDGEGGFGGSASSGDPPTLCVVSAGVDHDAIIRDVAALRGEQSDSGMPVILLGSVDEALHARAVAIGDAAVLEGGTPADNLLFVANELLRSDLTNLRASHRMLYGAICAFRTAGDLHPVFGLTYNISREGLFVRTLDPPMSGSVIWFEMRPLGSSAAVHLRAEVTWCRGLHRPGGATPPGFGMRILPQACPPGDLAEYHDAYEELRNTHNVFTNRPEA